MEELIFTLPESGDEIRATEFKEEFFDNNERIINGSAQLDMLDYSEWLTMTKNNREAETVNPNWVVCKTFFVVRKSDNKIIGIIDIRHSIEHEILLNYAGHIGYSVRPTERKKGYATKMLQMGLEYLKSININKAMLGCLVDNMGSNKTIKNCGGVLTETKPYTDGSLMNIYWIDIK
jgi:predicted acetyltransferase